MELKNVFCATCIMPKMINKKNCKLNFLGILFSKNWKKKESLYTTFVLTGVTSMGKIHIELFAFFQLYLQSLLSSPICSKPAACVQGTILLTCCDGYVCLSRLHSFPVALRNAAFNVFYRIWIMQMVYFGHLLK